MPQRDKLLLERVVRLLILWIDMPVDAIVHAAGTLHGSTHHVPQPPRRVSACERDRFGACQRV
jgi:hypothetical protein